jgi:hypothetical protein
MKQVLIVLLILVSLTAFTREEGLDFGDSQKKKRKALRHERKALRSRYYESQIEFLKPFTQYQVKSTPSLADNISTRPHTELGVRYTSATIKRHALDYAWAAAYIDYGSGGATLRFEGYGTYALNNKNYFMFGGNLQKFLDSTTSQAIDFGFGVQGLWGYQFTRRLGGKFGVTYTYFLEKEFTVATTNVKIQTSLLSPEIGLYWGF